jgi:two-component system chemotaxis sensor kinase CheA
VHQYLIDFAENMITIYRYRGIILNMKIRSKLLLAFGGLVLCIVFTTFIALGTTSDLQRSVNSILEVENPKMQTAWSIQAQVNEISKSIRNYILLDSEEKKLLELDDLERAVSIASEDFRRMDEMTTDVQGRLIIKDLERAGANYLTFQNNVMELAKAGDDQGATDLLYADGANPQQQLFQVIDDLLEINKTIIANSAQSSEKLYDDTFGVLLVLPLFFTLLGVAVAYWVGRNIIRNLANVSDVMDGFAKGSVDSSIRLPERSMDEIGTVARSFNRMAASLQEKQVIEEKWRVQNEEQIWLHSNLSSIHNSLQSMYSIDMLSNKLLEEIAPLLGAYCGIIYVLEESVDQNQNDIYKLSGTYAISTDDKHSIRGIIYPGDGVIGQVILSKEMTILTGVSNDQIRIITGLAEIDNVYVYAFPFLNNNKVEAVLEFVTQHKLTDIQLLFLERLGTVKGLLIRKMSSQNKIEQLLLESQTLTEELQQHSEELNVQQEELMQTNSELEEQTTALQESENRLQTQQGQLEEINADLEEKAQELEHQAQRLITASAYKSEFLANMSHELRTPLNSMLILAKLLAENRQGNLTKKQVEFATTVHSSGNDLLVLINQILDLARVESGKVQVNMDVIKVQELLDFVERNFSPVVQQKGLELIMDIQPDMPDSLQSDPIRLQQIIRNLLDNAIKFTDRGKVTFSMHIIDNQAGLPVLNLSVGDTGIGIPIEQQEIIFDAFVQVDGTTSRKYGGTGLGLSISRELAKLLGGEIRLTSLPGVGSTFTLILPFKTDEPVIRPIPPVIKLLNNKIENKREEISNIQDHSFAGSTILIIDDDIRNVFALSSRLETYDIQVLYADNGMGGIEMLKLNPEIDLILMDVMMPGMDGNATTREIRTMSQYEQLPIIVVTANARKEDREKSMDSGATDYITKPVEVEQLLSLLKIWLSRK